MTMITTYDSQGRYLSVGTRTIVPEGVEPPPVYHAPGTAGVHEGAVDLRTQYHDMTLNRPANFPPRPSSHHQFDYVLRQWLPDLELAWADVRRQRDQLLAGTDWTTMADVPLTDLVRAAWLAYRQALRDVTLQADPLAIIWPAKPN